MKNYKITKEQILETIRTGTDVTERYFKEIIPEAFKTELVVGKWYKRQDEYCDWLMNYQVGEMSCYGFNTSKKYSEHYTMNDDEGKWIEATPEEVEAALNIEKLKRYKIGDKVQNHQGTFILKTLECNYNNRGIYNKQGSGIWLIMDGKWAEILPQEKTVVPMEKALKIIAKKMKVSPENIEIKS